MTEPAWQPAVRSEDLDVGAIVHARLGDREVLVARLSDGEAVAFSAHCPHQDTPLAEGTIWDDQVRCRQHQYLYDPRTGENLFPARTSRPQNLWKLKPRYLPTYAVEERDGWVWVADRPNPPPAAYDPSLEQPPLWAGPPAEAAEADDQEEGAPKAPVARTKTVRVAVGAHFELRLPTNPLPGYEWTTEVGSGLVEVVEAGLTDIVSGSEPPRWRVKLAARQAGEDEVRCSFRAPWDLEPSEIRRYVVVIVPQD